MNPQEIALALSKIDWVKVECDDNDENQQVLLLKDELMRYSPKEIIDILITVIHAVGCNTNPTNRLLMGGLLEFHHMDKSYL
jgi:hypothetical protein